MTIIVGVKNETRMQQLSRDRGGFMKTTVLRSLFCALALVLTSGCSSLYENTPSRAWSQIAAREHDQQDFNASTQSDGEFYPFGAP